MCIPVLYWRDLQLYLSSTPTSLTTQLQWLTYPGDVFTAVSVVYT